MKRALKIFAFALVAAVGVTFAGCSGEHEHEYVVEDYRAPTCVADGFERKRCKDGDDVREAVLPALGHDFGTDNKCKRCGYQLKPTAGLGFTERADGGYDVSIGSATDANIVIPAYQDEKPVVGILKEGFACLDNSPVVGGADLETIEIPDGVKSVGERAFYGCRKLREVSFPITLMEIGDLAFRECAALAKFNGPRELKTIGANAFYGCTSIEALPSMPSLKTVGTFAFTGCTKLESAHFGDALESLGAGAFSGCTALKYATVAGNVTVLPENLFLNCTALTETTLSAGLRSIGSMTFGSCDALKTIRFGGTKEAWAAVSKASDWIASRLDPEDFANFYVYCSDGVVNRYGIVTTPPQN